MLVTLLWGKLKDIGLRRVSPKLDQHSTFRVLVAHSRNIDLILLWNGEKHETGSGQLEFQFNISRADFSGQSPSPSKTIHARLLGFYGALFCIKLSIFFFIKRSVAANLSPPWISLTISLSRVADRWMCAGAATPALHSRHSFHQHRKSNERRKSVSQSPHLNCNILCFNRRSLNAALSMQWKS